MSKQKHILPINWKMKTLEEIGLFSKGKGIRKDEVLDNGMPCIRYGEIYTKYDFVIKKFHSFVDPKNIEQTKLIKNNDLLFAGSGEKVEEIGKCIAYTKNLEAYAGGDIIILSLNKDVESLYFSYYLNTQGRRQINKLGAGNSVVHIYSKNLKRVEIPVPPLPEQQKIADILTKWDEGIEVCGKLLDAKKELKKGLMQKLLTGLVRFSKFGKSVDSKSELPDGWKKMTLNEIGEISSAGVDKKIIETETKVKLLNFMDIYKRDFIYNLHLIHIVTAPDYKIQKCNIKKGDVFFTPSSETSKDIAHSAVSIEDIELGVYSYHIVRLRPTIDMDLLFRVYAFKTDLFYKEAYRLAAGSGQRYVISQGDFRKMKVKIPTDTKEQQKIALILSTLDKEIELLTQKLQQFKLQKKGLMQKLLTGKIRVKI